MKRGRAGRVLGRQRDAELIGDRDRDDSLLERRTDRLGCEEHEAAEVAAAPDHGKLDAPGRQQEVGMVGDEWRAFDGPVDAEAGERGLRGSGLEHAIDEPEQADELGPSRRHDVFDVGAPSRELDDAGEAIEVGSGLPRGPTAPPGADADLGRDQGDDEEHDEAREVVVARDAQ